MKKSITIGRITRTPLKTGRGTRVAILPQGSKTWLSTFDHPDNETWHEGQTIEVEIEKAVRGDQTYWNIIMPPKPRPQDLLLKEIRELKEMVAELVDRVTPNNGGQVHELPPPEEESEDEEVPF